ncbi:tRNA (adenosine(37)-N6)-threonylcarbamoyltransferase complex ATPase subunit type 1 TsaE [Lonepinella sp. BR2357]|uniref:tRNA (adenosine(37)-N6)-threonylcarbamoyltransferase complex ATPase subunit type 1 TsaE n=1 Tax=Lonepinella sp. BR2357 TaxID=3434549 RepID=UPI003F6DAC58
MNISYSQPLADEQATCRFGAQLVNLIYPFTHEHGVVIYLNGELGAGKTTLSRGMIQGLGYQGNVKSPTYTLVETYHVAERDIYHFDLYRLNDPEELEFMGIRDYFSAQAICLIEWAEKGEGVLNSADLFVNIDYDNDTRRIELSANSTLGAEIITQLQQHPITL